MAWTVQNLLDLTQELIGEPVGGFYNIGTRLLHFNSAQEQFINRTHALLTETDLTIDSGDRTVAIPSDFLTFGKLDPTWVASNGDPTMLKVIPINQAEDLHPLWRDTTDRETGTPAYLALQDDSIYIFPEPDADGTLTLPYVQRPTELADVTDEAFNGEARLQMFAPALAYFAANIIMLPRSPQTALTYHEMFELEVRKARSYLYKNPQERHYRSTARLDRWS